MNAGRERLIRFLYIQSDVLCLCLAWISSFYLRFYGPFDVHKGIPDWLVYVKLIPFILVIWFTVFSFFLAYEKKNLAKSLREDAFGLIKSSYLALILFIAVSYFYEEYHYSRLTLIFFAILHPLFILGGRFLLKKSLSVFLKKHSRRKVLLIGTGAHAERIINSSALHIFHPDWVGFIGLSEQIESIRFMKDLAQRVNCPYFDIPSDWVSFFNEHPCESVFVALEKEHDSVSTKVWEPILEQVPDIKIFPDLSYLDAYKSGTKILEHQVMFDVHESPLNAVGNFQKRIFDIFGSLACIMLFSPILLVISILVKLSSRGKVIYTQERMGLDGRSFPIYKFRTMPENVEKESGAVWAKKDDGRVTSLGKWLRKTSLDELPQLFNVLFGHMSLVGPRPERPVFVSQFRRNVPNYMLRHKVKAGITGWAQVQGWRGNTSIEKRIESDLYYIQNWSLLLDIKILWMTLFKGFVHSNAY